MILVVLIILVFAVGILKGTKEGLVHIMPFDANYFDRFSCGGVRCHRWHPYYHAIGLFKMALFACLCIMLWEARPSWIFILGLLILLWESFEIAYSYSRHGKIIGDTELIIFVDIMRYRFQGWKVYAIHTARVVACVFLLIIGGFK